MRITIRANDGDLELVIDGVVMSTFAPTSKMHDTALKLTEYVIDAEDRIEQLHCDLMEQEYR